MAVMFATSLIVFAVVCLLPVLVMWLATRSYATCLPAPTEASLCTDSASQNSNDLLASISHLKDQCRRQIPNIAKALAIEYALQSVAIERNPLQADDALRVFYLLRSKGFEAARLGGLSAQDVAQLSLPTSDADSSHVHELKNHIVASQWVTENAPHQPGTPGLSEEEFQQMAIRTIRDTISGEVYSQSWGGRVELGGYRRLPIQVASNHLRIFPYDKEVPACMKRFVL